MTSGPEEVATADANQNGQVEEGIPPTGRVKRPVRPDDAAQKAKIEELQSISTYMWR
jgi:hypothetical protein